MGRGPSRSGVRCNHGRSYASISPAMAHALWHDQRNWYSQRGNLLSPCINRRKQRFTTAPRRRL
eukprot:11166084-Lingulodinium_polyedra.AAC.1